MRTRALLAIAVLTLVLAGCGGGSVSVRSNFSGGVSAPPPSSSPPAKVAPGPSHVRSGLTVSGGRGLGLVIVFGLMIADGVQWANAKLKQAFVTATPQAAPHGAASLQNVTPDAVSGQAAD